MSNLSNSQSALMQQYNQLKNKYPDSIILFELNGFYESFGKDAIIVSNTIGTVLTKNSLGESLTGFSDDLMIIKLVKAGYTVAVSKQNS